MVGTRNHPADFPEPATATATATATESPSKRATRTSTANQTSPSKTASNAAATASPPASPTKSRFSASSGATSPTRRAAPSSPSTAWSHTPSNLSLIWLAISLPLVIWDTLYVFLRPYSMPGGSLHGPWKPYALYGTIDHTYGFKAYNAHEGFTAAQGTINALETTAYLVYLYLVYVYGEHESVQGRGAPDKSSMKGLKALSESRTVHGRLAAYVVLLGYSTTLVTASKTVLYVLREACSGWSGIGHNSAATIFFMWIVPNVPWIVIPSYLSYVFGMEILQGLDVAVAGGKKTR